MKMRRKAPKLMSHFLLFIVLAQNVILAQNAPGPHVPAKDDAPASFKAGDRIVATYYFYWYNVDTKEHIIDGEDNSDALQDHPAKMEGFSYENPDWHRRELEDMRAAGIDVALPVFWGVPGHYDDWNFKGLRAMVKALDAMKDPPKIALLFDTTTLAGVDLTTDAGRRQFVYTVRDFYSMIPPRHWALYDGKVIVWLYHSGWPKKLAPFDREGMRKELGRDVFIIGDRGWTGVDAEYSWGAALSGAKIFDRVASVGPGYNDSAVPGRKPSIRDREDGRFYERSWHAVLRSKATIVSIETWNEFHEATDICESKEYGRKYIEMTRKFVDAFKKGEVPPRPKGAYSEAKEVTLDKGLRLVEVEDGLFERKETIATKKNKFSDSRYLYFDVDDSFWYFDSGAVTVEVEYLDEGEGEIRLQYDSATDTYKSVWLAQFSGGGGWETAAVKLKDARFGNGQNGGADFRLKVVGRELVVRAVRVRR